jgi:hypothetical protein
VRRANIVPALQKYVRLRKKLFLKIIAIIAVISVRLQRCNGSRKRNGSSKTTNLYVNSIIFNRPIKKADLLANLFLSLTFNEIIIKISVKKE